MEQHICTISPFMTTLFSVKDWLVNIFLIAIQDHSMQLGTARIGMNNIPACGLQGEVKSEQDLLAF